MAPNGALRKCLQPLKSDVVIRQSDYRKDIDRKDSAMLKKTALVATMVGALALATQPAEARRGWGPGLAGGLAVGAILGAAAASSAYAYDPYYYRPRYYRPAYYGYYGPRYYRPAYGYYGGYYRPRYYRPAYYGYYGPRYYRPAYGYYGYGGGYYGGGYGGPVISVGFPGYGWGW